MLDNLKFCVNTWVFGNTPIESVIKRASDIGFDGIELFVNKPEDYKIDEIKQTLNNAGIEVCAICTNFGQPGINLSDPEDHVRNAGLTYLEGCVDLAESLGARSLLVVPSQVSVTKPIKSRQEDLLRAVESLQIASTYAEKHKILLTIEPINRFEAGLIHTITDALELAELVKNDSCRIMGDTFHMLIEERKQIPDVIRKTGNYWFQHLHASDNTREAPGMGTIPWAEIMMALEDIEYEGVISLEPLPRGFEPTDNNFPIDKHHLELKQGLSFLQELKERV
jgi:D-psicose/D-tagatose/L-ribulose 3-epimerase